MEGVASKRLIRKKVLPGTNEFRDRISKLRGLEKRLVDPLMKHDIVCSVALGIATDKQVKIIVGAVNPLTTAIKKHGGDGDTVEIQWQDEDTPDVALQAEVIDHAHPYPSRITLHDDSQISQCVSYIDNLVRNPKNVFEELYNEVKPFLQQGRVFVFGKEHEEPRLTALFGSDYAYSKKTMKPNPITPALRYIKLLLMNHYEVVYDTVLVNYYRDGRDCIRLHSDNEDDLTDTEDIASVSLGAERTFRLRRKSDKRWVWSKKLASGSCVRMVGKCQSLYEHEVPRELRVKEPRINLTFRISRK